MSPVSDLAGVARHILDVARVGLPGWRLVVAAPRGPLLDEVQLAGCDVVAIDADARLPSAVRCLRAAIRDLRPEVVHSHLAKADLLCTLACLGLDIRLVSTEHTVAEDPSVYHASAGRARLRALAHRVRLAQADEVFAVSDATRRTMLRHWRTRTPIHVIRNGVDRQPLSHREPGLRVLSLSRLSPEKNIEMTLRAFALVQTRHPEATLTVAGVGPDDVALRHCVEKLGVADAVVFPGFVDAGVAVGSHDVLVQPSRAENLSYTILDAVAHGLGVVASDVGGNGEILPPHCLVALGDDDALAEKIIEQGTQLALRPPLPATIPTVAQMRDAIVARYAERTIQPRVRGQLRA